MKTIKSKKLNKQINTICDFNAPFVKIPFGDRDTGTDPTNTIVTTITTINTHHGYQKLTL